MLRGQILVKERFFQRNTALRLPFLQWTGSTCPPIILGKPAGRSPTHLERTRDRHRQCQMARTMYGIRLPSRAWNKSRYCSSANWGRMDYNPAPNEIVHFDVILPLLELLRQRQFVASSLYVLWKSRATQESWQNASWTIEATNKLKLVALLIPQKSCLFPIFCIPDPPSPQHSSRIRPWMQNLDSKRRCSQS